MKVESKQLPPFKPDIEEVSAFSSNGLMDIGEGEFGVYREIPVLAEDALDVALPEDNMQLYATRSLDSQIVVGLGKKVYLLANNILTPALDGDGNPLPVNKAFPFEFENTVCLMFDDGIIYKYINNRFHLVNADLVSVMADLGIAGDKVVDLDIFFGRLFVGVRDFVIWNNTYRLEEWTSTPVDEEGEVRATSAGYNQLEGERITQIQSVQRRLYIFTEDSIYDVQTANTGLSLTFTRTMQQVRYKAGIVNMRSALYFFTADGLRYLDGNGNSEVISNNIDLEIRDRVLSVPADRITAAIQGDLIIWATPIGLVIYNTKWHRFAPIQEDRNITSIGYWQEQQLTVGDFPNITVGGIYKDRTVGSFRTESDGFVVVVKGKQAFPLERALTKTLSFDLFVEDQASEIMLNEIAFPSLTEFQIQVRSSETTAWGTAYPSNGFGQVKLNTRYHSPQVRLTVTKRIRSLELYTIKYSGIRIS